MNRIHFIILMITLAILGVASIPESYSQNVTDDEIKAALVFKFPVYVRWPEEVMKSDTDYFDCCILGDDRLADMISQFDGEKLLEKTIRIKRVSATGFNENCHMLFISSTEQDNLEDILKPIETKPILTVGDMKEFARKGGIINLVRKKESVHFEININAVDKSGLKISSKLLRLADIISDK